MSDQDGLYTPARAEDPEDNDKRTRLLMSLLKPGRENVTPSKDLIGPLGFRFQTDLGALVNIARAKGYPIGSLHARGYFIMVDLGDLDATVEHLRKRRRGINVTIARLYDCFSAFYGRVLVSEETLERAKIRAEAFEEAAAVIDRLGHACVGGDRLRELAAKELEDPA